MNQIDKKLKSILKKILRILRIEDLFVAPEIETIYLFDSSIKLESLLKTKNRYKLRMLVSILNPRDANYRNFYTWDDIEYPIKELLSESYEDYDFWDNWDVIPLPKPGRPESKFYSVKNDQFISPSPMPTYRFCDEEILDIGDSTLGQGLLSFGDENYPPLFISHAVAFESFQKILDCKGFLWPSLAITWKVPPAYGDILFLADIKLLEEGTFPINSNKIIITESDSYSPNYSQLDKLEKAINFELRGDKNWWNDFYEREDGGMGIRGSQGNILYNSQKYQEILGGHAPDQEFIEDIGEIHKRFCHLFNHHTKVVGPFEYEDKNSLEERSLIMKPRYYSGDENDYSLETSGDFYPYMEMKVRGVLGINNMVACFYPRRNRKRVKTFLDKMGFEGARISVDVKLPQKTKANSGERVEWAQAMNKAMFKWAKADPNSLKTLM